MAAYDSPKIFISYRRDDESGNAGRISDHLAKQFGGAGQIFIDVDSIEPGLDFAEVIAGRIAKSDVVLAVIGRRWLDAVDKKGVRRLEDPNDFVRIELDSALQQRKHVIPVLIGDARMPVGEEIPESLRPLITLNAVRISHDRFQSDSKRLIDAIDRLALPLIDPRKQRIENPKIENPIVERWRKVDRLFFFLLGLWVGFLIWGRELLN